MVLDRFELAGTVASEELLPDTHHDPTAGTAVSDGAATATPAEEDFRLPVDPSSRGAQRETLPLNLTVAHFQ